MMVKEGVPSRTPPRSASTSLRVCRRHLRAGDLQLTQNTGLRTLEVWTCM
jgi:hypothetical protein